MRKHAANFLAVSSRVYKFRRDRLNDIQKQRLQAAIGELKTLLKERAAANKLKTGIEKLETLLCEVGGRHYPMDAIVGNVEFFLVAAIVILGLRAYFVQPFKIPTNSMWPTYYGITYELFTPATEPGLLEKVGRLAAFGAIHHEAVAPCNGEVWLPVLIYGSYNTATLYRTEKSGRIFGVFPTTRREYLVSVGSDYAHIEVPIDFNFDKVLQEKYGKSVEEIVQDYICRGKIPETSMMPFAMDGVSKNVLVYWIPTGQQVKLGEKVVSFDILAGDLLFVDRITYNFFRPKVGQGFVFKTENIHSPEMENFNGMQIRQYYIKRLVGTPGDTLEVKAPELWHNGAPITGAAAFRKNAMQGEKYPGYTAVRLLIPGHQVAVPEHNYFVMGDNSPESADSRYWGFVPEKDVVGRPLFIYYPLTSRWGPAR